MSERTERRRRRQQRRRRRQMDTTEIHSNSNANSHTHFVLVFLLYFPSLLVLRLFLTFHRYFFSSFLVVLSILIFWYAFFPVATHTGNLSDLCAHTLARSKMKTHNNKNTAINAHAHSRVDVTSVVCLRAKEIFRSHKNCYFLSASLSLSRSDSVFD